MEAYKIMKDRPLASRNRQRLAWLIPCMMFLLAVPGLTLTQAQPAAETFPRSAQDRLSLLEERQDLLVEAAGRDLGSVYFIFSAVSAFFALFVVFSALRSFFDERRRHGLEDQQMNQLQAMMGSFRDNVSTINSLISSLQRTFDVQADITKNIQTIDQRIRDLDDYREQEQMTYRSQVDTLNAAFADAFRACRLHQRDREVFKAEENRILVRSLAARLDTLELTGNLGGLVSPVSLFLRGLSRFNDMKYREAIEDVLQARDSARQQLSTPLSQYGSWDTDEIQRNLRVLIDETYYHIGIMYYNMGDWDNAKQEFIVAHERHPLDFRSRIYIPELLFFANTVDPQRAVAEFEAVAVELNNVTSDKRKEMDPTWEWCYASLKLRQGNVFLKKVFVPTGRNAVWQQIENNKLAIEYFWEAREKQPESPVVIFSLAQAMDYDGKSVLWKDFTPEQLFRDAFVKFRNQAIMKTEPILLTMLYYCAAISCFGARIPNDSPSTYLGLARQQLQRVPEPIFVFSPLNKIMTSHTVLLEEMDQIERWWQEHSKD